MATDTPANNTPAPALPATADIHEAAALMAGLDEVTGGEPQEETTDAGQAEERDTPPLGLTQDGGDDGADGADGAPADGADAEAGDNADDEGGESDAPDTDAPEFWSAEDKAAFSKAPPEVKAAFKKYEDQRNSHVKAKEQEAATARKEATEQVEKALGTIDQAAKWWEQAGPALNAAFADKWSKVNWTELAAQNPAEWARLNQIRMDERDLLQEANRRGAADKAVADQRAKDAHQQARLVEHNKLAAKAELANWFGTSEKSTKTYDELGKFLVSKGIPADRINQIYEAPVIELALNAMRFEQAQKQASTATAVAPNTTSAKQAPKRVEPGPPRRGDNRQSEAIRQVSQRFRNSGGASITDAAELIRLSGL
jgi:hypothetical protein